jgi:surfeit locus 1 family protein
VSTARTELRRLLLPGALAAAGLAILVGLGFWQVERLAWKEDLIARVEARTRAPALPISAETDWPNVSAARDEYRRVTASGRFQHAREVLVYTVLSEPKGRFFGQGYWVLTPLELASGAIVIVNRGFVPLQRKDPASRREGQIEGPVSVSGLLRMAEVTNWFTPTNEPARGAWYRRDPAEIAKHFSLARAAPFMIDADTAPVPGALPQGGETRLVFPNNHLGYALTWFGLALALLGVFTVFAGQRLRGEH